MSQPDTPPPAGRRGTAMGCALFTIGMLFLVPSGLCTAVGGIGMITELVSRPDEFLRDLSDVFGFAALTLTCLAIGIALVWAGVRGR